MRRDTAPKPVPSPQLPRCLSCDPQRTAVVARQMQGPLGPGRVPARGCPNTTTSDRASHHRVYTPQHCACFLFSSFKLLLKFSKWSLSNILLCFQRVPAFSPPKPLPSHPDSPPHLPQPIDLTVAGYTRGVTTIAASVTSPTPHGGKARPPLAQG